MIIKIPTKIMIHHTAVSYDKNADQWLATNNYHKSLWNFISSLECYAGYNYEISKNGKVRQARADGETTAAAYQNGLNSGICIHIAIDGNFDEEMPSDSQIFALRDLLLALVDKYNIKAEGLMFHMDVAQKTCPGKNVNKEFIKSLVPAWTPSAPVIL